jgi:hypothetical protein
MQADDAARRKERLIATLTTTPERAREFETMRLRYVNKAVSDAVKNIATSERIVEYDGRLIQKIYPIYEDDHQPAHWLDFSANLHQPSKYFLGRTFDTLYFNLAVIWSMTIVLFITLYYDVLKRFIRVLENRRKYRRKDRS